MSSAFPTLHASNNPTRTNSLFNDISYRLPSRYRKRNNNNSTWMLTNNNNNGGYSSVCSRLSVLNTNEDGDGEVYFHQYEPVYRRRAQTYTDFMVSPIKDDYYWCNVGRSYRNNKPLKNNVDIDYSPYPDYYSPYKYELSVYNNTNPLDDNRHNKELVWVDELKKWIYKEPDDIEYIHLSKIAPLHEQQIFHRVVKSNRKEHDDTADRFLDKRERYSIHSLITEKKKSVKAVNFATTPKPVKEIINVAKPTPQQTKKDVYLPSKEVINQKDKLTDEEESSKSVIRSLTESSVSDINKFETDQQYKSDSMSNKDSCADQLDLIPDNSFTGNLDDGEFLSSQEKRAEAIKESTVINSEHGAEDEFKKEENKESQLLEQEQKQKQAKQDVEDSKGNNRIEHNENPDDIIGASLSDQSESDDSEVMQNENTDSVFGQQQSYKPLYKRVKTKPVRKERVVTFDVPAATATQSVKRISDEPNFDLDVTDDVKEKVKKVVQPDMTLPELPNVIPTNTESQNSVSKIEEGDIRNMEMNLLKSRKKRWGRKQIDTSYLDELARERLAEERKQKAAEKLKKAMEESKKKAIGTAAMSEAPRFESYGFLAKYCILKKYNIALYKSSFDVCDEQKKNWLSSEELIMAMKGVNPCLKDIDFDYINMVMHTCDYHMKNGADFKLFSVLAALSEKITEVDDWIRNYVKTVDFRSLEKKTYFCRKLWKCIVDPLTNTVPISKLCLELKAGGVREGHIQEVRQRMGWMQEISLLDYLTYIPLFVMIHTSIVNNPLDMSERI